MKTLHVYFLSDKNLSDRVTLHPRIIDEDRIAIGEDNSIPRICCSNSIKGCIDSIDIASRLHRDIQHFWLYEADVDIANIIQPISDMVPDSWFTGEFWITESQEFILISEYTFRATMKISPVYSRYIFSKCDPYGCEIADRVQAYNLYGGPDSFSFIEMDHESVAIMPDKYDMEDYITFIDNNYDSN